MNFLTMFGIDLSMEKFIAAHVTNAFVQAGADHYIFVVVGFDGVVSRFKIIPSGEFAGSVKYDVIRLFRNLEIPINQVVPAFGESEAIALCLKAKKSEWYS